MSLKKMTVEERGTKPRKKQTQPPTPRREERNQQKPRMRDALK
jgi:hypothetical protein